MKLILEFDLSGLSTEQRAQVRRGVTDYADGLAFDLGAELIDEYVDEEETELLPVWAMATDEED